MPETPLPVSPLNATNATPTERGADPELVSLPAPPRRERVLTVALMVATMLVSCWLLLALRGEVTYALSPSTPVELGELTGANPPAELSNRYARATGLLGGVRSIRYERPMEGDSYRLAPIAGNPQVWVEIRVPEGMEGAKFTPPSTFVGRLVPMRLAGIRHRGLAASVAEAGAGQIPEGAWLLVDGSSPRASRWAVALGSLLLYFILWNGIGVARLVRKVADDQPEDDKSSGGAADGATGRP
jgi:hypothetical protein